MAKSVYLKIQEYFYQQSNENQLQVIWRKKNIPAELENARCSITDKEGEWCNSTTRRYLLYNLRSHTF